RSMVALAGAGLRGIVEFEEGDDATACAFTVAVIGMVAEGGVEIQGLLYKSQTHDAAPKVDVCNHVGSVAGDVVITVHSFCRPIGCRTLRHSSNPPKNIFR